MTIIAEGIPSTWFDRLTMTGHPFVKLRAGSEPFDSPFPLSPFDAPFALSLSKGERFAQNRLVEGCRNVCANNYVFIYRFHLPAAGRDFSICNLRSLI